MSERRAARGMGKVRAAAAGPMPAELMMGPCIEVWAGEDPVPAWGSVAWPAHQARRHWAAAVDAWALQSGWATDARPASHARDQARTSIPWSREFLIEQGRAALVDYYEGRRADRA